MISLSRILFVCIFTLTTYSLPSLAIDNKVISVGNAYKEVVNKIIGNDDCFYDEILLIKPKLLDDGHDPELSDTYSTRFSTDIFADFYADNGVVNGGSITVTPPPKKPSDTLRFLCIAGAIQSTIDNTRNISEFKKIVQNKLLSMDSGQHEHENYTSKYLSHEFSVTLSTITIIIDKVNP